MMKWTPTKHLCKHARGNVVFLNCMIVSEYSPDKNSKLLKSVDNQKMTCWQKWSYVERTNMFDTNSNYASAFKQQSRQPVHQQNLQHIRYFFFARDCYKFAECPTETGPGTVATFIDFIHSCIHSIDNNIHTISKWLELQPWQQE